MDRLKRRLLKFQRNEITEHFVYRNLARTARGRNREILGRIAADELRHYGQFKGHTGMDVRPDGLKILFFTVTSALFGLTFTMKMMEHGEEEAEAAYTAIRGDYPEIRRIIVEELKHEKLLMAQIEEEHLSYIGSMALALNNSAQEFTGIAVGLTFAMQNARMTGITTLISGLAATLAMVASEYLSQKSEKHALSAASPLKAALYAGGIYLFVVLLIVTPYFLTSNHLLAMSVTMGLVLAVLVVFTFFMSVVRDLKFSRVFGEAVLITALVVSASFGIGTLAHRFLGAGH